MIHEKVYTMLLFEDFNFKNKQYNNCITGRGPVTSYSQSPDNSISESLHKKGHTADIRIIFIIHLSKFHFTGSDYD